MGKNLPSKAIGKTSAVSGSIALDASGAIVPAQSKIQVDLRTLKSDQDRRDQFIQGNVLQTSQYPYAVFVPTRAPGLTWPLPTSGSAKFTMDGTMTVHGTSQPMTWDVAVTYGAGTVTGSATTPFKFSQFGMEAPKVGPVLSVEDGGSLAIQFTAKESASAS